VPPVTKTGRGALSATSMCASTGMSFHRPGHFWKLPANCHGKFCAMSSTVSPQSRRASEEPISPAQLEKTTAMRGSSADAHSTVLPSRECPKTAMRRASIAVSLSK
jgi:hypothetical protein